MMHGGKDGDDDASHTHGPSAPAGGRGVRGGGRGGGPRLPHFRPNVVAELPWVFPSRFYVRRWSVFGSNSRRRVRRQAGVSWAGRGRERTETGRRGGAARGGEREKGKGTHLSPPPALASAPPSVFGGGMSCVACDGFSFFRAAAGAIDFSGCCPKVCCLFDAQCRARGEGGGRNGMGENGRAGRERGLNQPGEHHLVH